MWRRLAGEFGGVLGFLLFCAPVTRADDAAAPTSPPVQKVAVNSSFDTTSVGSTSVELHATFAPIGDINGTGFRLGLAASQSWYKVKPGTPPIFARGQNSEGDVFIGYNVGKDNWSLTALIGPAFGNQKQYDPNTTIDNVGVKTLLSFYGTPTNTTMAYASTFYSTLFQSYNIDVKGGLKVFDMFYFGPEAILQGSNTYRQERLGIHLSGFTIGPIQLGVQSGAVRDLKLGWGEYLGANLYSAF